MARSRYDAVKRGRSRKKNSTPKMRSCITAVLPHKFVKFPKKKLPMPARFWRKKRKYSMAAKYLHKIWPRHVFMKDLEDLLREYRERSNRESVKTDSVRFWDKKERDSEAMDVDESTRDEDVDESTRYEDVDESTRYEDVDESTRYEDNSKTSFKNLYPNRNALRQKFPIYSKKNKYDLCPKHEATSRENSWNDCMDCLRLTLAEVKKKSRRSRTNFFKKALGLNISRELKRDTNVSSGDSQVEPPGNNCQNPIHLDQSSKLSTEIKPSKIVYNDLRIKLDMIRKRKSKLLATADADINSEVVNKCEMQPYVLPSIEGEKSIEVIGDQGVESSNIAEKSDCETVGPLGESFSSKVSRLKFFESNTFQKSEMQPSVLRSHRNKTCIEMLVHQNAESSGIAKKSDCEILECQKKPLSSKATPIKHLDSDVFEQCETQLSVSPSLRKKTCIEIAVGQNVKSSNIAEKSNRENVECLGELISSKASPLKIAGSSVFQEFEMFDEQNLESSSIADKIEREAVEYFSTEVSPPKYLNSDVFQHCELQCSVSLSRGEETRIEMSVDQNIESRNVKDETDCEIVEYRRNSLPSKVPSVKYLESEVFKDCEILVDQNIESTNVAVCEILKCQEERLSSKTFSLKCLDCDVFEECKMSVDQKTESSSTTDIVDREIIECQGKRLSSEAFPLQYFGSTVCKECEMQPFGSPSRANKTCTEMFENQILDPCKIVKKPNCEAEECQEIPHLKCLGFEANRASKKLCISNVRETTDEVSQSEIFSSEILKYFNACSEISQEEILEALEYISGYAQN